LIIFLYFSFDICALWTSFKLLMIVGTHYTIMEEVFDKKIIIYILG